MRRDRSPGGYPEKRLAIHWMRSALIIALIVYGVGVTTVSAENIVNLPVGHWVYDALERLAATGWIESSFLTIKPMRRADAARLVSEALEKKDQLRMAGSVGFDWTEELIRRLQREFYRELEDYDSSLIQSRLVDTVEVESLWADLDGQKRLPRPNQDGRSVREGLNGRLSWRGWVQASPWLAVTLETEAQVRDNNADLWINEGTLKLSLVYFEIEIGREQQWWGPGEHGALLLSNNARGLDLIRLASTGPFKLPWKFSKLGRWKWVTFVARLEQDRDRSRAKLGGARIVWSPIGWLELGISRTTLFGGKGGEHFTLRDAPFIFVGYGSDNVNSRFVNNDNKGAWDVTLYVPGIRRWIPAVRGMKLYREYAGEDNHTREFLGIEYKNISAIAELLGLSVSLPRADLTLEYTNTVEEVPLWYQGGFYTSGYTFEGQVIGHEVGGDADDLSLEGTFYMTPEFHVRVFGERERVGFVSLGKKQQVLYAGELGLVFSRLPQWEASLGYRFEHVIRPDLVPGTERNHHLISARMEYHLSE